MVDKNYTKKLATICFSTRHGDATKVAEKTGFSVAFCSSVLRGHFINEQIIDAAYALCKGRAKNLDLINKMKGVKGVKEKFFNLDSIVLQD